MRHRGEEGRLDSVGGLRALSGRLEVGGSLGDLALEALVQLAERFLRADALADVDGQDEDPFGHGLRPHVEPPRGAVGERELNLVVDAEPLLHAAPKERKEASRFDAGPHVRHFVAQELGARPTVLNGRRRVEIEVAPIEPEDLAPLQNGIERRAIALLALLDGLLGAFALGDVDAHPDEAGRAIEHDPFAREEVRCGPPVFRDERGFDRAFPLLEDFGDPPLKKRLLVTRKEVERVHLRDLVSGVARYPLEVPIPAQESPVLVVKIEDARHGLDEASGKSLLALRSGLGALALGDVADDLRDTHDGHGSGRRGVGSPDRGGGDGDREERSVLALADRLELLDARAAADSAQDHRLLGGTIGRDRDLDGATDDLRGAVTEHAFRRRVPARDHPLERLADDGIVRRLDDGDEALDDLF